MPRSTHRHQCTAESVFSKADSRPYTSQTNRRHSLERDPFGRAFTLLAVVAIVWPAAARAAAPGSPTDSSCAAVLVDRQTPVTDVIWWILYLLGGDPSEIEKATTTTGQMQVLESYYAAHGIPSNLSSSDRLTLMGDIDDLYCRLMTQPPPDVSTVELNAFIETLKDMWARLGGLPGDLGC